MLEETHKSKFVWKGFFIGPRRKEGALLNLKQLQEPFSGRMAKTLAKF
jgi:hypothetical protein